MNHSETDEILFSDKSLQLFVIVDFSDEPPQLWCVWERERSYPKTRQLYLSNTFSRKLFLAWFNHYQPQNK